MIFYFGIVGLALQVMILTYDMNMDQNLWFLFQIRRNWRMTWEWRVIRSWIPLRVRLRSWWHRREYYARKRKEAEKELSY
jgi:hypothetical protein